MTARTLLHSTLAFAVAITTALSVAAAGEKPHRGRGKSREYQEALVTIDRIAKAKQPSVASGTHTNGKLANGCELPASGFGYKLADPKRKTHFGTDEMTFGIIEIAALLQEIHPGNPWMSIGDIAGPDGGKLSPHINHQDGQDADIAFAYCTPDGQPVDRGWLKCDAEGKTANKGVVFDTARNFEWLTLAIESPHFGGFQWILCYDPLKKLLVEHGHALAKKNPKKFDEIEAMTAQIQKILQQPKSSAHDDHFHIRINRKRG